MSMQVRPLPRFTRARLLATAGSALLLSVFPGRLPGRLRAEASDPPEALMKKMLEATKNKDYETFLSEADDTVKGGITKQMFEGVSGMLAPRLRQGYKTSYLTKLRQRGHTVYLWKLEFADGKDEALLRLSQKDGKVSGILIQ